MAVEKKISGVHVWLVLWKTQKAFEAKAFEHISSLGICPSDFGILEILLHKGDLPVNDIGKKMLLTSGSITSAVDRVEVKGFVARKDHPSDRRVKVVSLTAKGRKFIKEAFANHKKAMEEAVSPLSATERKTLTKLLNKIRKSK
jgi:MarR family 2-MHQ and catechol resistance regulon transcriptional repressor